MRIYRTSLRPHQQQQQQQPRCQQHGQKQQRDIKINGGRFSRKRLAFGAFATRVAAADPATRATPDANGRHVQDLFVFG